MQEKKFIDKTENCIVCIKNSETFCIVYKVIPIFEEFLKGDDFSRVLIHIFIASWINCALTYSFLSMLEKIIHI